MDSNEPQQPSGAEGSFFNPIHSDPPVIVKHSGPGIASFVLSMVSLLGYIVSVALIGALISPILDVESNTLTTNENMVQKLGIAVLVVILFILMNVIGLILGIVGVSLKNRKKIFAILGLILNGVILLSIASFFVISVISSTT